MSAVPLHEEIINEIGTQTLARFGLNIFSLNTYAGYEASIKTTNIVKQTYKQHKNNDKAFGQYFEDLDVGTKNIKSSLLGTNEKTYTTDELSDIKKAAEILHSGKKIDNLNDKDKEKFLFVINQYPEEVDRILKDSNMLAEAKKNHPSIDTVTFDSNGNIKEKSQHKVIKNTKDLLKDRYLNDNDVLTMPYDDYKRHKENLEKIINDPKQTDENKEKARKARKMLNKNNILNRFMCENPNLTANAIQTVSASAHMVQAGVSDAIVVTLSTLANGAIFEIKDAFKNDNNISISQRIKRLLKKVLDEFYKTFKRGASYGALEVGIGLISQIFKSFSSKIMSIWKTIRKSAKSIFNAIYSFITGEIKSYKELLSTIVKGLLSAITVVGTVALETQLEAFLAHLVTPMVASYLAPALSIIIGSIAVVISMKSVDVALNALFGVFAKANLAKMKAEKIKEICAELLPDLIAEKEELKELINKVYQERKLTFEKSFDEFRKGLTNNSISSIIRGLESINNMYGEKLQFQTFEEFNKFMCTNESFRF